MTFRSVVPTIFLLLATRAPATPPELAFTSTGEGLYQFDTGVLRGRLKLDGKYQGLYPLVDAATGEDLVHPPGVFSFYRVFTTNRRYGNAARDWPTRTRLLAGGAVEVRWPPAEAHPFEMTGLYRWSAPDTLDLEIAVQSENDMPGFELFMSSYFTRNFRAAVYLRSDDGARFVPVDRTPDSRGGYVMFPENEKALSMILDGRWKIPPSPVDWALVRWLAEPMAVRRDADQGLTALMMCPPDACFAISSPWNPASPDAGGYRSLYLSLFGRDLEPGQTAHARCRLIIRRDLSDDQAIRCYREVLEHESAIIGADED
jgi:hypothetical protein